MSKIVLPCVIAAVAADIAVTIFRERGAPWKLIGVYWILVTAYWIVRALA